MSGMTLESFIILLMFWLGSLFLGLFMERLCSCYFPFLLSARYYYVIKNRQLRDILISPQMNRSQDSKTARRDRNKLPLIGCIYCIVLFTWLLVMLLLLIAFFIISWCAPDSWDAFPEIYHILYNALTDMIDIKFFVFFGLMPLLYRMDYALGMQRWFP